MTPLQLQKFSDLTKKYGKSIIIKKKNKIDALDKIEAVKKLTKKHETVTFNKDITVFFYSI